MQKSWIALACCTLSFGALPAQDTFSICAVDLSTGEVGSAGASCIAGSVIISDVHPGTGVIHTQALYTSANQQFARSLMNAGLTPQEIIDSVLVSDSGFNPTVRQYGVAMFVNGQPQTKAYTGANCMDYKNHIEGVNYTIQGNILLGQQVLDSMESRFLNTQGDLACKLMAAMQGAKIVGADTRCMSSGNSSLSAFLRVAKPTDTVNDLFINLNVQQGPAGFEPIDSLQTLFEQVHNCSPVGVEVKKENDFVVTVFPNPSKNYTLVRIDEVVFSGKKKIELFDNAGKNVFSSESVANEIKIVHQDIAQGMYRYVITSASGKKQQGNLVIR
jgi:uncharacterized Ntn-hydrolase superfamily protein